jgi:tRNA A37 methylthiotransferase MiaB
MTTLVELVQRIGRERNQLLLGETVEVMVERASRHAPGEVMGRTRGHKPVNFPSGASPGDLVQVTLLEATSTSFRGRETEGTRETTTARRVPSLGWSSGY